MFKKTIAIAFFILSIHFSSLCQNWQSLGTGMDSPVRCFYPDTITNTLYAGGNFSMSGGIYTWGVAKWNGAVWDSLGGGMAEAACCFPVFDIIRYKGSIYVAGGTGEGITKWNGSSWVSVGGGVHGSVFCLYIYNNELYVGGAFDSAGTITANGIAKWDDTIWSDVGGFNNYNLYPESNYNRIYAVTSFDSELYIGGQYRDSTGGTENISRWNGTSWNEVGGGFHGGMSEVGVFATYNNELYVGGPFNKAAGNPGDAIAKWNGTNWSEVGGGMTSTNAQVIDLTVFNNELYASGSFTLAGGVPVYSLAKWDGGQWCGLGNYPSYSGATNLGVHNNELYVACDLIFDNDTMNYIVKWIGGNYVDTCGFIAIGINEENNTNQSLIIYPNPSQSQITIEFDLTETKNTSIEIKNVLGQTERIIDGKFFVEGKNKIGISIRNLSKGLYFLLLQSGSNWVTKKIIIE